MILGIGCDVVNIERLEKPADKLPALAAKILSPDELAEFAGLKAASVRAKACFLAKRFAAKEALAKALGSGFRDGLYLHDISIVHNAAGKPDFSLSGKAEEILQALGNKPILHLSLSDDYPFAQALAIIEQ